MQSCVDMSKHQICADPNIWVFDDLLSDQLLNHVDAMFEGTDVEVQELRRRETCKPRNFESIEIMVDSKTQEIVDVIRTLAHIREVEPCQRLRISDVWGASQYPHMDGIDMDYIGRYYRQTSFLDLQKQSNLQQQRSASSPNPHNESASSPDPLNIVPTFSFVIYFNSVGGIRFPRSNLAQDTIPGKRGRIIMFQNYLDSQRPAHNSLATHYGIYVDAATLPKRLLTMGILANETPVVCGDKLGQNVEFEGLIYSTGLKDEGHGYMPTFSPPKPPTPPPKEDHLIIVDRSPEPDMVVFRNVAGDELCVLEFTDADDVKKLVSQLYGACNVDSDKYEIQLMLPSGTMLTPSQKIVSALPPPAPSLDNGVAGDVTMDDAADTAWKAFFKSVKDKPDTFYEKCIETLAVKGIFQPRDLLTVDVEVLKTEVETGQMTIGVLNFIEKAAELAKTQFASDLD